VSAITTAHELIVQALKEAKILGVGQMPQASDVDDALKRLNMMVGQWNAKRWLIYNLKDVPRISNGGQVYTVGPGGEINITRPNAIQSAYIRARPGPANIQPSASYVVPVGPSPFVYQTPVPGTMTSVGGVGVSVLYSSGLGPPVWTPSNFPIALNAQDSIQVVYSSAPTLTFFPTSQTQVLTDAPLFSVDRPLTRIASYEDYSRLTLKGLEGYPTYFFYDPKFPLGELRVWPTPQANIYEIHIIVRDVLKTFENLGATLNIPPEYTGALLYNLAVRLRSMVGLPPDPVIVGLARDSLEVLRSTNAAIQTLNMPFELQNRRTGGWRGDVTTIV
jgi:hypothetical protein